ncbi:MAG: hypothetical protein SGARI_006255, partial [Bacillariaceae sp.]
MSPHPLASPHGFETPDLCIPCGRGLSTPRHIEMNSNLSPFATAFHPSPPTSIVSSPVAHKVAAFVLDEERDTTCDTSSRSSTGERDDVSVEEPSSSPWKWEVSEDDDVSSLQKTYTVITAKVLGASVPPHVVEAIAMGNWLKHEGSMSKQSK